VRQRTVGLATWEGLPQLGEDDRLLLGPLRDLGIEASPVVWSDDVPDPTRLELVVLRSTWDYHHRRDAFLRWIERVGRATALSNDPSTVRWNHDKHYLADLAARGLPVVPTVWGSEIDSPTATMRQRGWARAVLKPCVSASGEGASVLSESEPLAAEQSFRSLRARGEVMLQPFLDGTLVPGERSLVYLDGRYSHAVVRAPKFHDGPSIVEGTPVLPSAPELAVGERTVASIEPRPLYARVDLVPVDGAPHLMELELIEPLLYLGAHHDAPQRFAQAIAGRLR
jgi:hypothetical protein